MSYDTSFYLSGFEWENFNHYINSKKIFLKIPILAYFAKFCQNVESKNKLMKTKEKYLNNDLSLVRKCILQHQDNNLKEISKHTVEVLLNEWNKDYILSHCRIIENYGGNIKPLWGTDDALYDISVIDSKIVYDACFNIMKTNDFTLTDATSAVGFMTIHLSSYGIKRVNSVEKNIYKFVALKNNVEAYNLIENVTIICGDYFDIYDRLKQDCVYINVGYLNKIVNLTTVVNELLDKDLVYVVICEVPSNYDIKEFISKVKNTKLVYEKFLITTR